MNTLLKTPNNLEFLQPLHGFAVKASNFTSIKPQKFGSRKFCENLGKRVCVEAKSSTLLELVSETKKENLDFELPMYDPSKELVVDLVVVGGGPAGLAVAQQAMDLLDCLDATWSGAVVYVDDDRTKNLDRPYGRVNRKQLKSKMMEKCILNGVKFHQANVIKATVVLDATGFSRCLVQYDKPYNPGYQVAYGILAEVEEHPFDTKYFSKKHPL
ncbi:hypothetical protein K7X08_007548 [Anisodus acutangulus]|uniref:Uncharacterized protein n=1 Tax=Anisodus acutangulus TaxID=402998 RepID=A0A9Q1LFL2_9SOLA|nr:hypothetical protein K7X08_007548 [Anisodus acutangulus]